MATDAADAENAPARVVRGQRDMEILFPCTACARHVRASDAPGACPFCGESLTNAFAALEVPGGRWRLRAISAAAVAASLAALSAGCIDDGSVTPLYGAPCPDGGCVYPTDDAGRDAAVDGRVPAEAGIGENDAGDAGAGDSAADGSPSDASNDAGIGDASAD